MQSILDKDSEIRFEVFTTIPEWFFKKSLSAEIGYHYLEADIGLVQVSPFHEDIPATLKQLKRFVPFDSRVLSTTADTLKQLRCAVVLCDIAPMGLVVAKEAGISSVLIENFTWDWIYSDYQFESKQFKPYIDYMKKYFSLATYHIKTKPFCQNANPDLTVAPVSRKPRSLPSTVRTRLGLGKKVKIVLLTMGGISDKSDYADGLADYSDIHFLIPGENHQFVQRRNITFLPFQSDFFHPDLVYAADAVIGKVGYSTVAEVYQAGKPFGYVSRPTFRESSVLEAFILDNLAGFSISNEELNNGNWLKTIDTLIGMPIAVQRRENGADAIAEFVLERLQ